MLVDRRIVGLDAWRAALLLGGPITHAASLVAISCHSDPAPWHLIQWGTHLFRMQAFFFISGVVASVAASRRQGWLSQRLVQLGLPLICTWLFVLSPTVWLQHQAHTSSVAFIDPQHLWFLVVLLIATIVTSALAPLLPSIADIIDRQRLGKIIAFWAVAAALIAASTPIVAAKYDSHQYRADLLVESYRYGAFYLAGALFSRCPRLLEEVRLTRLWIVGPIAWAAMMMLCHETSGLAALHHPVLASKELMEGSVAFASVPMCLFVVNTALRVQRVPGFVWRFSRASFTVYLLHLPILYALFALPGLASAKPLLVFAFASSASLALSLLVHGVFARFAWYRIMFNGRIEGRARNLLDLASSVVATWHKGMLARI